MSYNLVFLGEVCEVIAGQSPPSITYNKNGIGLPFFQGKADFGTYSPSVRIWCSSPKKIAEAGDILISVRAPVGPTNLCDQKSCIGRGLSAIRVGKHLKTDYLRHFLKHNEPELSGQGRGSTFSAITQKDLKEIQIPLPSLEDQKRIVKRLDAADLLRQKRKQAVALLDDYLKSVFLEMFGDPVTNPKGWEVENLGSIFSISSGSTPSRNIEKYYKKGTIPWVKTTEVNWNNIEYTEEKITKLGLSNSSCKIYPQESVIIAMYGQGKTRGKCALLKIEATTNQACCVITPKEGFNMFFLFNYMKYSYENLRNLGRGGNQPNLNVGIIKNYEIFTPPLNRQNIFAEIVQNAEQLKQTMLAQSEELDNNFNALMQRAFH